MGLSKIHVWELGAGFRTDIHLYLSQGADPLSSGAKSSPVICSYRPRVVGWGSALA